MAFKPVRTLAARTTDALSTVIAESGEEGLDHPVFNTMLDRIAESCRRIGNLYGQKPKTTDDATQEYSKLDDTKSPHPDGV
jgi:hypothetical protein